MLGVEQNAMPSSHDPAPSNELLLYAAADTRFGVENRWFIAGGHRDRLAARLAFQELCEEFPHQRVILLLVASIHDAASGRFRDVIIESRGIAPLIDRKRLQRLTQHDRPLIAKAVAERRAPILPPPGPSPGLGWWVAGWSGAVAMLMLLVLLRS